MREGSQRFLRKCRWVNELDSTIVRLKVVCVTTFSWQSLAKSVTLQDAGDENGQADQNGTQDVDDDALVRELRVQVADAVDHRFSVLQCRSVAVIRVQKFQLTFFLIFKNCCKVKFKFIKKSQFFKNLNQIYPTWDKLGHIDLSR